MNKGWWAAFWTLWGLLLLSWILLLCGVAAVQSTCYDNPVAALADVSGVHGFTNTLVCNNLYRLYWFIVAFLLVVLIGLAVSAATGGLIASALSWMAWMAVLSLLLILGGDAFLGLRDVAYAASGVWWSRAATAAAGFILAAIFALGLTFLLGWRQRRGGGAGGGPMKV
ncbi:MAG: hypothetical protein J3K34DRAFT_441541 [Monoraphidium minutum]|nr:MAG: hypothetical protein J3K34DRAFT_441541 [Monoraphidium minutum]